MPTTRSGSTTTRQPTRSCTSRTIDSSYQNGAVEIKANAVPDGTGFIATDMPASKGNFYPQVTANTKRPQWLLSTATDFTSTTVQRLQSAGTVQTLPTTSFVTVVPGAGGLRLRWAPVAGASSYTIRRMDANGTTVVASGVTSTTFLDINGIPAMGVQYTVTAVNGSSESIPRPILIPWGSAGSRTPTVMTPQDYDGDGRADVTVYRSSSGEWFSLRSSTQTATGWWWGAPAHQDQPVPGDYDGDGKADLAVYRRPPASGSSAIHRRRHVQRSAPIWRHLPVPGDYDGDGKADLAVYRPATGLWFVLPRRPAHDPFRRSAAPRHPGAGRLRRRRQDRPRRLPADRRVAGAPIDDRHAPHHGVGRSVIG